MRIEDEIRRNNNNKEKTIAKWGTKLDRLLKYFEKLGFKAEDLREWSTLKKLLIDRRVQNLVQTVKKRNQANVELQNKKSVHQVINNLDKNIE